MKPFLGAASLALFALVLTPPAFAQSPALSQNETAWLDSFVQNGRRPEAAGFFIMRGSVESPVPDRGCTTCPIPVIMEAVVIIKT